MKPLNTLQQRTITGTLFGAIMIGGVCGSFYSFLLLFLFILVAMLIEYFQLTFRDQRFGLIRMIAGCIAGALPFLYLSVLTVSTKLSIPVFSYNFTENQFFLYVYVGYLFLLFILELFLAAEKPFSNIGNYLTGLFYIGLPVYFLLDIAVDTAWNYEYSRVLGLLLLIWTNDSWAYLIGSKFGKKLLFPRISPKKTWEGTIGGILMTVIAGYILSRFFVAWQLSDWIFIALIAGIFGTLGDLVESMLKRSLQIKDSGNILPGHGGLLDRFDAFIFIIPFVYIYLKLIYNQL